METKTPSNEAKNEGESDHRILCIVVAHPPANITWLKDGQKIIDEPNGNKNDLSINADDHWIITQVLDARHCENNDTCMFKVSNFCRLSNEYVLYIL